MRCHMFVEQLPLPGLREAEDSLAGMCDFYSSPFEPIRVPTTPKRVTGRVVGTYTEPVYPATDE